MIKRQSEAPKGSFITAEKPPTANSADELMIVSEPNQVAKMVVLAIDRFKFLPASTKSSELCTFFDAQKPINKFSKR